VALLDLGLNAAQRRIGEKGLCHLSHDW
jgi:hypothetical protein